MSSPALIGICLGSTLLLLSVAAVTCFCYRRRSSSAHKLIYRRTPDKPVGLRRPTAVRSPGSQGHYLKKSPSPTGKPATPGSGSEGGGGGEQGETTARTPAISTPSPAEESKLRSIKCFSENELSEKPEKQEELQESSELGQLHFRVRSVRSAPLQGQVSTCSQLRFRVRSLRAAPLQGQVSTGSSTSRSGQYGQLHFRVRSVWLVHLNRVRKLYIYIVFFGGGGTFRKRI